MTLENNYYTLLSARATEGGAAYRVRLLADSDIYAGHFPGRPVCPGICNMQLIRECAERLIGQPLRLDTIKTCRLTAVATPQVCPEVEVSVQATPTAGGYAVAATIADDKQTYMDYKGEMEIKN